MADVASLCFYDIEELPPLVLPQDCEPDVVLDLQVGSRGPHRVKCPSGCDSLGELWSGIAGAVGSILPLLFYPPKMQEGGGSLSGGYSVLHTDLGSLLVPLMRISRDEGDQAKFKPVYRSYVSLSALMRVGLIAKTEGLSFAVVTSMADWQLRVKAFVAAKRSDAFLEATTLRLEDIYASQSPRDDEIWPGRMGLLDAFTYGLLSNPQTGSLAHWSLFNDFFKHEFLASGISGASQHASYSARQLFCQLNKEHDMQNMGEAYADCAIATKLLELISSNDWEPLLLAGRVMFSANDKLEALRDVLHWQLGSPEQKQAVVRANIQALVRHSPNIIRLASNAGNKNTILCEAMETLAAVLAPDLSPSMTWIYAIEQALEDHLERIQESVVNNDATQVTALKITAHLKTLKSALDVSMHGSSNNSLHTGALSGSCASADFVVKVQVAEALELLGQPLAQTMLNDLALMAKMPESGFAKMMAINHILSYDHSEAQVPILAKLLLQHKKVADVTHTGFHFLISAYPMLFKYLVMYTAFGNTFIEDLQLHDKMATKLMDLLEELPSDFGQRFVNKLKQGKWRELDFYNDVIVLIVTAEAAGIKPVRTDPDEPWLDSDRQVLYDQYMPRLFQALGFVPAGKDTFLDFKLQVNKLAIRNPGLNEEQRRNSRNKLSLILEKGINAAGLAFSEALTNDPLRSEMPKFLTTAGNVSVQRNLDEHSKRLDEFQNAHAFDGPAATDRTQKRNTYEGRDNSGHQPFPNAGYAAQPTEDRTFVPTTGPFHSQLALRQERLSQFIEAGVIVWNEEWIGFANSRVSDGGLFRLEDLEQAEKSSDKCFLVALSRYGHDTRQAKNFCVEPNHKENCVQHTFSNELLKYVAESGKTQRTAWPQGKGKGRGTGRDTAKGQGKGGAQAIKGGQKGTGRGKEWKGRQLALEYY